MTPSLWDIEASILGLSEILESPESTEDERAIARGELERWVQAEVGKVDRIRGFLRHCDMMEAAAKEEAEVMQIKANIWANRARRLKDLCMAAMGAIGKKRIEGRTGVLRIQANGGLRTLKITNEGVVPDEYCDLTLKLKIKQWRTIQGLFNDAKLDGEHIIGNPSRTPNTDAIRKVLETKCPKCGGAGEHPSPAGAVEPIWSCIECNGTGFTLVPGAELLPRGESLRCA